MAGDVVPFDVLAAFCNDPTACTLAPLGSGNINDTFLVRSKSHSFVLQRINENVFPKPLRVIENFQKITSHLTQQGDVARSQLQFAVPVLTLDKRLYYLDSKENFWRGQSYLPHESFKVVADPKQAFRVGKTLGTFHRLVSDFDVRGFLDPLPDFHNLPRYLEEYDRVTPNLSAAASEEIHSCMATIDRYRRQAATLEHAKFAGILTLQPIHGDPKVDNFLFSDQGQVLGLLDLDTVAMGLVHYDLGDCLRSCCNKVGEAGGRNQPVKFDMVFCQAILDGYFAESDELLSKEQRNYIFDGVLLICFELGVRFFTDHLRGNPYFKVQQDGENLLRAVNQFRLVDDIARGEREIRAMSITSGVK